MRLLIRASAPNAPMFVTNDVDPLDGLNRRGLVRFFVTVVAHVLAIDGHCRRRFGGGAMSLVFGATNKRDQRKRD
jgi:hypothetical protein